MNVNREKKTSRAIKRMLSGDETGQQMLFEVSDSPLRKTIFKDTGVDSDPVETETDSHEESEKHE
jgi:hypothetical protein